MMSINAFCSATNAVLSVPCLSLYAAGVWQMFLLSSGVAKSSTAISKRSWWQGGVLRVYRIATVSLSRGILLVLGLMMEPLREAVS